MTLGMIVSAALLMVFANASSKNANVQRASSQIENGRFLAELMRDDLQLAGYFGELVTTGATFSTPDPCATAPTGFAAAPLEVPTAVRGYTASESLSCLRGRNRLAGTDAVAVRRVDVVTVSPAALPASGTQYHLQSSFCQSDASTQPLVFDADKAQFTLRNRACTADNPIRPYVARIYYVASCNVCNTNGGDGVPTLKRIDLVGNELVETALVEGVEDFRIEYGFDTDNNGSVNAWRLAPAASGAASEWSNVMAVRVHYVVRSLEKVVGAGISSAQTFELGGAGSVTHNNDGFARRAYSLTVRLINPSSSRETT